MATSSNGGATATINSPSVGAGPASGNRLPEGLSGLLIVGKLGFGAVSTRNAKQFVVDVETRTGEGRTVIESASGWLADQDGGATELGRQVMNGEFARLMGRVVALRVSYNVGVTSKGVGKLYLSIEGVHPLDGA